MSLKMCGLLVVIDTTRGLIERIKTGRQAALISRYVPINLMRILTALYGTGTSNLCTPGIQMLFSDQCGFLQSCRDLLEQIHRRN